MILFVDTEHASGYSKPWGERLAAARMRLTYRLEDLTGDDVHLVRYDRVDPALVARLGARAVFLSGSATELDHYGDERRGIDEVVRSMSIPTFGFCGGLQMMACALGVEVARIGPLPDGVPDPNPDVATGMRKEYGYLPTPIVRDHEILEGLGSAPVMRHAHSWELKAVPEGFTNHAATEISPIQLLIHDELPVMGSQFHPEYWTDEHPAGRTLIADFCRFAGLLD